MIDIFKTYRTREGNRVRGLSLQRQKTKVFIHGELRDPGTTQPVIVGQAHMMDDLSDQITWCIRVWDEEGRDLQGKAQCDLIEYVELKIQQPQLF